MSTTSSSSSRADKILPRLAYKIHEAAEILGIEPITVRRMIKRGLLKPCRALRHVLIPVEQLEKLLSGEKPKDC